MKFSHSILTSFILLNSITIVKAQTNGFDSLTNIILLKIRTYNSDSSTTDFLKKYSPELTEKPLLEGVWTAYPPQPIAKIISKSNYQLTFTKHPFISLNEENCCLNVITREIDKKPEGYETYYVSFFYHTLIDATKNYNQLLERYKKLNLKMFFRDCQKIKNVSIMSNNQKSIYNQVQLLLLKNETGIYGNYKIIVSELLNDKLEGFYKHSLY